VQVGPGSEHLSAAAAARGRCWEDGESIAGADVVMVAEEVVRRGGEQGNGWHPTRELRR
jgi:hypothetical protein